MPFTGGNETPVNQTLGSTQTTSLTDRLLVTERPMQSIGMDDNGNVIVVWSSQGQDVATEKLLYGVYGRRYDAVTKQWGPEFLINQDLPTTDPDNQLSGDQLAASVAVNQDGSFIVTWTDGSLYQPNEDIGSFGVYARRYDSTGKAIADQFRVNQVTAGDQSDSSIASNATGDFVVTWTSRDQDGDGRGVFVRRFSKDGTPKIPAADIQVNTYTTGDQIHSTVAIDDSGNFVVVWESASQDGSSSGIYGQRFNADGSKNGAEFRINTITVNDQVFSSVSMDATGNFVVTWTSNDGGANGRDVYARRYSSTGAALDAAEFVVNTNRANTQQYSQVKLLKTGDFLITWTSTDADGTNVYGRRYNFTTGQPLAGTDGNDFAINTTVNGNQEFSAIAGNSKGDFASSWTSDQAGSDDVYSRIYQFTPNPNNPPTDISFSKTAAVSAATTTENVAAGTVVGNLYTTDADIADTAFTYQLVAGTGSDDNAAFQIVKNAATGLDELRIINSPDFETKPSYSIRVRTTDPGGLSFEKALTVIVSDLNEAPTDILLSKQDIDENAGPNAAVGTFSTSDPDQLATEKFTYSLVTGAEAVGTDNAAFTIVGNALQLNASANFEAKSSYTVRVQVVDKGGLVFKKTLTISVNDKNEAPTGITIDKNNINENVPANSAVGTFTTVDPDKSDTDISNGFTYTLVAGVGSTDNAAFTIVGRELRINQSPDFETKPSYAIRVRSTDKGGLFTDQTFTVAINNLPETPTNVAPTDVAVIPNALNENAGAGALVGTFSSTDANAGDTFSYALVTGTGDTDNAAFQVVKNPTTGKTELRIISNPDYELKNTYSIRVRTTDQGGLNFEKALIVNINNLNEAPTDISLTPNSVKEDAPLGTVIGDFSAIGDPDQNETFTYAFATGIGSTDNGAFALTPAGKLSLNTALDYETKTTYSIRVKVTDKGGLSIEKVLQVLVTDVAEPGSPTDIGLSKTDIDENLPVNSIVGTLSSTDVDSPNGPFTYTIVPNSGDAADFTISGNQLILKPSANFEAKTQYTVNVKTTDPTNLSFTKTLIIKVNDKNEAPTDLNLSANVIQENKPANSIVGTLTTIDPDLADNQPSSPFTYALVGGAGATDNSAFTITNGNELRLIAAPDFETKPSYSIRIRTTDKGGLSFEKILTVNVQNVGETPTNITLSATVIDENKPAGSAVGIFSTVDPDLPNDSFTYSLVAGAGSDDNAAFQIVKNGANSELRIINSPNFEVKPSYAVRVRTSDKDGLTFEKSFIITVNNLPETPIDIGLSKTTVDEDVPANTVVGTLNTVDSDLPNDSFTYQLVAGTGSTDNAAFQIVGNQLQIVNSPNFEAKPSYSIRIKTVDKSGLTFEKVFTIAVNNLTETPTDIGLSKTNVDENVPGNTVVGTLNTVDPDLPNDSFTYQLVTGTGSTDNAAFQIVGNQLQIKTSPNFEAKPSYSIRIKTTDKSGQAFEKVFAITVNNLKEAPTDIGLSKTSVDENVPVNTVVGTLSTVDSDLPNDSFTYQLVTGTGSTDNAAFQIVGNQLQIKNSPDFETKNSYAIRVRTTDKDGLFFEKALTIAVIDSPETPGSNRPRDINLSSNQIDENRPSGSIVGLFSTVDPDINDKFIYDLVAGDGSTDNSAFAIVNNELRIRNSFDYETKQTYSIRVRTRDAGSLAFEKVFTVNVKDLPERPGDTDPTDLLLSKNTVDENVPADSVVGTFSTVDPDKGDTFTYSLEPGFLDNSAFRIVGNELRIVNSPDFETKTSYSVRVITTDFGGRKFAKTFTIGVNNLNDPPVVTTSPGGLFYNEGSNALAVDPGISLTDIDSPNLVGATIRFTSGFTPQQDILDVPAANGITANYDAATGVLTLTGTGSLATYQNLLRSLTYRNSSQNPGTAIRTIAFTVRDAASTSNVATRTVQTIPVDSPPVVATSGGSLAYTENAGEVAIDAGIAVSDIDSPNLTSATVQLTNYNSQQDQLDVTAPLGINSNFDAASGTLTLNGIASVASYQAALRSVTYLNTSGNPSTTPRTVRFSVRDGSQSSNSATRTIQITQVNSPPVVTTSAGSLSYIENSGKQLVDPQITILDPDSQNLTGAIIRLQNYLPNQDRLSITAQAGITSSYNTATGELTLTGTASIAAYQTVLRSLTYINTIDNPAIKTRIVEYSTKDDTGAVSASATRSIQVTPLNDAPIVTPSVKQITFSKGQILIDSKLSLKDIDSSVLNGATVSIGNYVVAEDDLLFKDQNGITGTFDRATGVLQLTGSASLSQYQTALRSVQFSNSRAIPTATPRTLTVQVTDGIALSDAASGQIQVQFAPSGIVPAIDLNGTGAGIDYGSTFVVGGPAVSVVASDARFTDQAYPILTSAQVTIVNPLSGASEWLTANTTGLGIKADYNPANGVLQLTGRATPADYLKVLRSVQYHNNRSSLDSTTRAILFRVSNGNSTSEPAQTRVQISQVKLTDGTLGADGTLYTTPATDIIDASGSDDTVASILANLQQDDSIKAGTGRDTFVLLDGTGTATVDLNNSVNQVGGILSGNTVITGFEVFRLTGFAGTATLIGNEQDNTLVGGIGNDLVLGEAGNDVLGGNAGNDTLDGGAGDDQLEGGLGDDLFVVDSSNDLVIEGLNEGLDQVQSAVDYTLGSNLEMLTLTGSAAVGIGNSLDNQITGNAEKNRLNGEAGNDRLIGMQGRDTLVGGSGKDRFVLTEARKSSRDIIRDFRSVDDTIEIQRSGFSDTLKLGKIRKSAFCLGAKASDRSDRFIYNRSSGALFFDADGSGGVGQVQIARLSNKAVLNRSDIVIVNL